MTCLQLLKNLSVLLVEDEHNLAYLLRDAIGDRFRSFHIAHDGEEGLAVAETTQPDLVVTDITMPNMDGLKMSAILHERRPGLPIVILSAYSDKEYLLEAIDVGVTKYLIKPFDPDEMLGAICTLMRRIRAPRRIRLMAPFVFDTGSRKLFRDETMVRLSRRENLFLDRLLESPGHFMSFEAIKALLWDDATVSDERLRVFINRLRHKTDTRLIENLIGQGYLLHVANAPEEDQ